MISAPDWRKTSTSRNGSANPAPTLYVITVSIGGGSPGALITIASQTAPGEPSHRCYRCERAPGSVKLAHRVSIRSAPEWQEGLIMAIVDLRGRCDHLTARLDIERRHVERNCPQC